MSIHILPRCIPVLHNSIPLDFFLPIYTYYGRYNIVNKLYLVNGVLMDINETSKYQNPHEKIKELDRDGDNLALDFVNTVYWRNTKKRREWLNDIGDLNAWTKMVGLSKTIDIKWKSKPEDFWQSLYTEAIQLRECLYGLLEASIEGQRALEEDWEFFNDKLATAMSNARLHASHDGYEWSFNQADPLRSYQYPILKAVADLLISPELQRLTRCSNPQCGWLFLDKTKNRSKQYCCQNPCANRVKAHKHYLKKKLTG